MKKRNLLFHISLHSPPTHDPPLLLWECSHLTYTFDSVLVHGTKIFIMIYLIFLFCFFQRVSVMLKVLFEITPPWPTAVVWDTSALLIQCLLILFDDKAVMNKVSKIIFLWKWIWTLYEVILNKSSFSCHFLTVVFKRIQSSLQHALISEGSCDAKVLFHEMVLLNKVLIIHWHNESRHHRL